MEYLNFFFLEKFEVTRNKEHKLIKYLFKSSLDLL